MTAGAVVPIKTLQERISDRIHESIGELITEEDLKGIVAAGCHDFFFKPRTETSREYGGYERSVTKSPLIEEIVRQELGQKLPLVIDNYLKDNPKFLQETINQVIREGAGKMVLNYLDMRLGTVFSSALDSLRSQGLLKP